MKATLEELQSLHEEIAPPQPPEGAFTAAEYAKANNLRSTQKASGILNKAVEDGVLETGRFEGVNCEDVAYYWRVPPTR